MNSRSMCKPLQKTARTAGRADKNNYRRLANEVLAGNLIANFIGVVITNIFFRFQTADGSDQFISHITGPNALCAVFLS